MIRPITLTEEIIERMQQEFAQSLRNMKMSDGGVKYEKKFVYPAEAGVDKATVLFTPYAWLKMKLLLIQFETEVAWHGVVERRGDAQFIIKDILVYPQEVSGSTVNTDQERYQKWMMELPDEVYNNLRSQMHSHVNFGTTPSSVDLTHQEKILDMMDGNDYYIFFIWNKRMEKNVRIFDLENNILYDGDDVIVEILDEGNDFNKIISFMGDAAKEVVSKSYAYGTSYNTGKKSETKADKKKDKKAKETTAQQTALPGTGAYGYGYQTPSYSGSAALDRHDKWYRNLVGDGDDLD